MSNNVILSLASNYTYSDLKPFIQSLNKTGFNGTVYFVVNAPIVFPELDLSYTIKQWEVKSLKFDSVTYKVSIGDFLKKIQRRKITGKLLQKLIASDFENEEYLEEFVKLYHCQVSRFAIYLNILLKNNFDNVFLTDSRDVIFQSDPFSISKGGIHSFQENKLFSIKDRWFNNHWVKLSTNFLNYLKVRQKGIFCSGTILGEKKSIVVLLKTFIRFALKNNLHFDVKGLDQGLYNVLLHNHEIKDYQIHDDQKHILTLSTLDDTEFKIENNVVTNIDHNIPAVVHQYDRHEALVSLINGMYAG